MRASGNGEVGSCLLTLPVIAKRKAIDLLRTTKRTRKREVPLEPGFDPPSYDERASDNMGLPDAAIVRQIASARLTPRRFERSPSDIVAVRMPRRSAMR